MKYLGFANKFFTLWEVTTEKRTTEREVMTITHHVFIKNVSISKDKALAAYPGIEFDSTLKGHSSWDSTSYDRPKYADDEFPYGKYAGQKVSECGDIDYLRWAYDSGMGGESVREIIRGILTGVGDHFVGDYKIRVDADGWADIQKRTDTALAFAKSLETNGYIDVTMIRNLSYEGYYTTDGLNMTFPNIRQMDYGYGYALPIMVVKGTEVGKKVKGKTIRVWASKWEYVDSTYPQVELTVDKWNFLK